ncbi:MAG: RagB/SusD family nutrient uptake outer membrane protein, partial [Schleiferiaceae bacterium]|nr:RagB/SusD family nutrient uptake outer membrane protein [Schleiferiaceae bacterium]
MKQLQKIVFALAGVILFSSCEKILYYEPEGPGIILEDEAIKNEDDLQQLLNSVYDVQANFLGGQNQNLSELLADNLILPNNQDDYQQVWRRGTNFFNGTIEGVYADAYRSIYRSNVVIKDMQRLSLSDASAKRFEGESRFIRAMNHFAIVRQFAIPYDSRGVNNQLGIGLKTAPTFEAVLRSPVEAVYAQILIDLKWAEANLPEDNGVYANAWAAKAMLAKDYLEQGNWQMAYDYADEVINSGRYSLGDLDRFSPGSHPEAIFELV